MSEEKRRKRARRNRLGRIGLISVLPYLTFPHIFGNVFGGNLGELTLAIGALIGFSYALFELRSALKQEAIEEEGEGAPIQSGVAKARGLISLGAGMAVFAYMSDPNLLNVLGIGGLSMAAAAFALGLPTFAVRQSLASIATPRGAALPKGPLETALDEADEKLRALAAAANQLRDSRLRAQVFDVHDAALAVVRELQRNLSDLPKARRFLVTYLDGAVKIVESYVGHAGYKVGAGIQGKFSDTLVTMETTFIAQLGRLRDADAMDLDIQMDVLDAQMKDEGARRNG